MADSGYPDLLDDASMTSEAETPHPEPSKKKRKAWGQPIPDFKVVLPPRKRAKTAEEKEQRKNERVIRNRKAADKSRQRQKAAVAQLEVKTGHMEAELRALRAALSQYQATFGSLPGIPESLSDLTFEPTGMPSFSIPSTHNSKASTSDDTPTPTHTTIDLEYTLTPSHSTSNPVSPEPALAYDSPAPTIKHLSPSISPTLFPAAHNQDQHTFSSLDPKSMSSLNFEDASSMTQYPAVILCDPQCQPEATKKFDLSIYLINLTHLITIYETFLSTMLSPMSQIFQLLKDNLAMTCLEPEWMDQHFGLIHSLITTPSSPTTRPIFRMKLLSRLLACSPSTARLLKAATDRALQRLVDSESISIDRDSAQQWASLTATRWAIEWLEQEHQRYRLVIGAGCNGIGNGNVTDLARQTGMFNKVDGVDYVAVERSLWRWGTETVASIDVH